MNTFRQSSKVHLNEHWHLCCPFTERSKAVIDFTRLEEGKHQNSQRSANENKVYFPNIFRGNWQMGWVGHVELLCYRFILSQNCSSQNFISLKILLLFQDSFQNENMNISGFIESQAKLFSHLILRYLEILELLTWKQKRSNIFFFPYFSIHFYIFVINLLHIARKLWSIIPQTLGCV